MRQKLLGIGAAIALIVLSTSSVFADTTGGGTTDLGLDAVQIQGGTVNSRTGAASLSGVVTCSQDVEVWVYAELDQVVGRLNTVRGWGSTDAPVLCLAASGTATFAFDVFPDAGKFAGGTARVFGGAEAGSCDDFGCAIDDVQFGPAGIKLKGGKG